MKVCAKCKIEKEYSEFSKRALSKDSLMRICKSCDYKKTKLWQENNRIKTREKAKEWRDKNTEHISLYKKKYRKDSKERILEDCRIRKARIKQHTPKWANLFFIEEAYELAKLRTKSHGFVWQVDHCIPISGWINGKQVVSGLHVENNIRVIPKTDNSKKGYWNWPDRP